MAGRGGLTPGAGRKFGAKDRIPRARRGVGHPETLEEKLAWEQRRNKWASAEIGRLVAENEKLREQLNHGTPFYGDSKALLEATMAGTYFPSAQQLYSARELMPHQHPRPELVLRSKHMIQRDLGRCARRPPPNHCRLESSDCVGALAPTESEFGIFDRPEYLATIAAVTKALVPYPDARRAVAEALRKLENARPSPVTIEARAVEA
jgi:hypothetical protein